MSDVTRSAIGLYFRCYVYSMKEFLSTKGHELNT